MFVHYFGNDNDIDWIDITETISFFQIHSLLYYLGGIHETKNLFKRYYFNIDSQLLLFL